MERREQRYVRPTVARFLAKRRYPALASLFAVVLFAPLSAAAHAAASGAPRAEPAGLREMTDEKLARVAGKGFSDERIFQKMSVYASDGNIVKILGDRAILLNPIPSLLDPAATFRDAIFNPNNPGTIIDRNGSTLVRFAHTLINVSFEHIRLPGSSGPSFGSIFIRGLDLGGTTVIFTPRK